MEKPRQVDRNRYRTGDQRSPVPAAVVAVTTVGLIAAPGPAVIGLLRDGSPSASRVVDIVTVSFPEGQEILSRSRR